MNIIGKFKNIYDLWKEFPNGGKPGDLAIVDGVEMVWSKILDNWTRLIELNPDHKNEEINGDLIVREDLHVAGKIYAYDINLPHKGLFDTEDALKKKYPNGRTGDWALVGKTNPFHIWKWVCNTGWCDTEQTADIHIDANAFIGREEFERLLSAGYIFVGVIEPTSKAPAFPNQKFAVAFKEGTYTNFGGIELKKGDTAIFEWSEGKWKYIPLGLATSEGLQNVIANQDTYLTAEIELQQLDSIFSQDWDGRKDYVVTDSTYAGGKKNVGKLIVFTDNLRHVVTEVFITHYLVKNGEITNGHDHNRVFIYSRNCDRHTRIWSDWKNYYDYSTAPQYLFDGFATTDDIVTPSDRRVYVIASTPGTYAAYGNIEVAENEVAYLLWDGKEWTKKVAGYAKSAAVKKLIGDLSSLQTTDKSNIISAINEVFGKSGVVAVNGEQGDVFLHGDNLYIDEGGTKTIHEAINEQSTEIANQDADIAAFKQTITNQVNNFPNITINGDVTNAPDEEDLTQILNEEGKSVLRLKDRGTLNGMGYVILRKDKTFKEQVEGKENTIFEIRYDFDLGGQTINMGLNCALKFEGGSLDKGTIILNNSLSIESTNYQIFKSDLILNGSYLGNYPIEWFGASSNKDHNEVDINRAINLLQPLNGGTLILTGCYEINDTINLKRRISIIGNEGYKVAKSEKFENNVNKGQSCFLVNFSDRNKWIIDTAHYINKKGAPTREHYSPYNELHYSNYEGEHDIYNIINLQNFTFKYKENSVYVYGGIRVNNMLWAGSIKNICLDLGTYVGIALQNSCWGIDFSNVLIYSSFCGIYLGNTTTFLEAHNIEMVYYKNKSELTYELPILLETTKPKFLKEWVPTAIIAENASALILNCVMQEYKGVIAATNGKITFEKPYIELVTEYIAWNALRGIMNFHSNYLPIYETTNYAFGATESAQIIVDGLTDYSKCYPANSNYINYKFINCGNLYYDSWEKDSKGNIINKQITSNKSIPKEGLICIVEDKISLSDYRRPVLISGFIINSLFPYGTTFDEVVKRGYDNVRIQSAADSYVMSSDEPISNKNITFCTDKTFYSKYFFFGKPLRIKDSNIKFTSNTLGNMYPSQKNYAYNSILLVSGNNNLKFEKVSIQQNPNDNISLFELEGDNEINVTLDMQGGYINSKYMNKPIFNENFQHPYTVTILNTSLFEKKVFTNKIKRGDTSKRPTKFVEDGFQYYDETLGKYIWKREKSSTKWIDANGAEV